MTPPARNTYYFTARDAYRTDDIYRTDLSLNFAGKIGPVEVFVSRRSSTSSTARAVVAGQHVGLDRPRARTPNSAGLVRFNPFTDTHRSSARSDSAAECTALGANWQEGRELRQADRHGFVPDPASVVSRWGSGSRLSSLVFRPGLRARAFLCWSGSRAEVRGDGRENGLDAILPPAMRIAPSARLALLAGLLALATSLACSRGKRAPGGPPVPERARRPDLGRHAPLGPAPDVRIREGRDAGPRCAPEGRHPLREGLRPTSPSRFPSHVSLFTGLEPGQHGVLDNAGYRLDPADDPTLAELLKKAGYATGGAISAVVLELAERDREGLRLLGREGGVEAPDQSMLDFVRAPGKETAGSPARLDPPRGLRASPLRVPPHLRAARAVRGRRSPTGRATPTPTTGRSRTRTRSSARFLDELKRIGLYDRAMIVFLSDHGEGLGDHGEDAARHLSLPRVDPGPAPVKLPGGALAGHERRDARSRSPTSSRRSATALARSGLSGAARHDVPRRPRRGRRRPPRGGSSPRTTARASGSGGASSALSSPTGTSTSRPRPRSSTTSPSDPAEKENLAGRKPPELRSMVVETERRRTALRAPVGGRPGAGEEAPGPRLSHRDRPPETGGRPARPEGRHRQPRRIAAGGRASPGGEERGGRPDPARPPRRRIRACRRLGDPLAPRSRGRGGWTKPSPR